MYMYALVITPFIHPCGTVSNIKNKIDSLNSLGFKVILLVCGRYDKTHLDDINYSEVVFWSSDKFGVIKHSFLKKIPDPVAVDAWVDSSLDSAIKGICKLYKFKLCIVNYVFLSKAFDSLSNGCIKILETHDVFTKRNEKLREYGFKRKGEFYFSCIQKEEEKAINRADFVLAVTQEDRDWFQGLIRSGNTSVFMQPPVLKKTIAQLVKKKNH